MNIDFDVASSEWRKNKIYLGNGEFRYKCCYISVKNIPCKNIRLTNSELCKIHNKNIKSDYNTRSKKKIT